MIYFMVMVPLNVRAFCRYMPTERVDNVVLTVHITKNLIHDVIVTRMRAQTICTSDVSGSRRHHNATGTCKQHARNATKATKTMDIIRGRTSVCELQIWKDFYRCLDNYAKECSLKYFDLFCQCQSISRSRQLPDLCDL